jgi:penicillin-binding protein 2
MSSDRNAPGPSRRNFLLAMIGGVVSVLGVRLYRLQIVEGAKYQQLADLNRLRVVSVEAPRGVIYDRNGQILARNQASFKVSLVPADLPKLPSGEDDLQAQGAVLDRLLSILTQPQPTPTPSPAPTDTPTLPPTTAAMTQTVASVAATPTPNPDDLLTGFMQRQPWIMSRDDMVAQIASGEQGGAYRSILVARYIPQYTAFLISEDAVNLPGVQLGTEPVRDYLTGSLTSQLVGYMGGIPADELPAYEARGYQQDDQVGLVGLEKSFEDELRGKVGTQTIEVDVNGNMVSTVGQPDAAQPGHNLVLTIDAHLQLAVTQYLQEAMDQSSGFTKVTQAAAVVMDPRNGAVLALVSLPSYDNNWFSKGITSEGWDALNNNPDRPMVNKATGGQYPPGSTFKMVTSSAGLQTSVINVGSILSDPVGVIYLPNEYGGPPQPFYCWIYAYGGGHGSITIREAIAESCDVFFYQLGGGFPGVTTGIGVAALGDYALQFGLGQPTGIDLQGEASGLVPTDKFKRLTYAEPWFTGDTYNMAIGQGYVLATPLQMANVTAAVANGGALYRPQLVDHITAADGHLVRGFQPQVIRQIPVDPSNLAIVREGMYGTVNWDIGTAPSVRLPGINVAGKTGTAEYAKVDASGKVVRDSKGNLPSHAWFTSFAPYEAPEVVVTVFLNNGGEGSQVSAPVVAKILRSYFGLPQLAPGAGGPLKPGD